MEQFFVSPPSLTVAYPIVRELGYIYSSEVNHNQWTSGCVNYSPKVKPKNVEKLVAYWMTFSAIPIIICSNCTPCSKIQTFAMDLNKYKITVHANSSYSITLSMNPFCGNSKCGSIRKRIRNELTDPMTVYLDTCADFGALFTFKNQTYISGYKGPLLRIIQDKLKNTLVFIIAKFPEAPTSFYKGIANNRPMKLDNLTLGNEL